MSKSPAIYRYTCNSCGTVTEQPTDTLPEGWLEITVRQKNQSDRVVHFCLNDGVNFLSGLK